MMMLKSSLALVAVVLLVAVAEAHPRRSSHESSEESMDMDMSDWMDEMMEKKDKMDEKKEHFEMFMKMMKFMKEMKEKKEKMEESKEFHDLFKAFAKMVWKKESMGSKSMSEESSEEKKSGDKDMMKMFMEEKDGSSSEEGSSEEGEKDEKMKKMFVLFMQFKSHMMKQKKMEEMKEKKEEKAMKQMKAFKALITFAHKVEEKKEMMHKMMEMVEKKMKAKFMMFKKCAFEGKCMKGSGSESSEEGQGSHTSEESSEEMGEEMKMMKEMMEGKSSGEHSGESKEEDDKEEERMHLFMAMKKMMEHGGENEEAMEAMKNHLSKNGDKEMWGNDHDDEKMKMMKKMFMMAKSMKMMKAMKEDHKEDESAKLFKFMIFMKHMEEAKMMERSFAEFMGWKQEQMMMKHQKSVPHMTYFDIRGRGEITRLMFAAGKKEYTETRVPLTGDAWTLLKPTMPYGQLPILNISGQVYGQSLAIQAYIAKETGFYPEHTREQMRVDEIALAREDLFIAESNAFGVVQQDPTRRAELTAALIANAYPLYFGRFAQIIRENEARSGFAVGDKPTMADFVIFEGTTSVMQSNPQVLDAFPELKALRVKMAGWPGVAEYLAMRPYSEI